MNQILSCLLTVNYLNNSTIYICKALLQLLTYAQLAYMFICWLLNCVCLFSYTTKYCQVALRSDDVSQGFIIGTNLSTVLFVILTVWLS